MKRICCALALTTLLASCSGLSQPTATVMSAPKRELTAAEKLSFAPVLSSGLKDPSAAQFKWMPVILTERDGITDYCGLVNGKNSYGGYTGFVRFYAHLTKNEKGQFVKAELRAVEPPNRETNFIDPRWLNGICEQFGYDDFSLAR
jgi:PBP1b-binding outer membrane lipoprotein LpoB